MFALTLPDGAVRQFDAPTTGMELATSISKGLAKEAVAISVNGDLWDLTRTITADATVAIITRKTEEGLDILRHDAAHIMAEAVKELYPDTQVTIGPSIANGFYYDFARDKPFSEDELQVIEERMHEIVARDEVIERTEWDRDAAIAFFKSKGEIYKAEIIESIPTSEPLTVYKQGEFADLCRGPHLPSTGKLGKGFKLMKVAGAYWRGDSNNEMLQRIYGTAWANEKDLKKYLFQLEEAEKRDHRKLGKEMDLFHFQEEAPGSVFWHPKGWSIFLALIGYMRRRNTEAGYLEINTPDLMDRSLWEKSGHWEKFGENMFTTHPHEEKVYALKPMNCPGCVQVYRHGLKSYRDLPLRMSEFGKVHRFEPSGALHGLMRVRSFTQDDAHVFCTEDMVMSECQLICDLVLSIYRDFGFNDIFIKFSDRPEKRVGSDEVWDKSEEALKKAVEATGLSYSYNPGEGAFYGPKLEFVLRDALGRDWQCGTLQVDLNLPERLDANYIAPSGDKQRPVMLHRALFGSLERFTGILLEHYAGKLPIWLAPIQATICTITSDADEYAKSIAKQLEELGLRFHVDLRNEKINLKVREHSLAKTPFLFVVGRKEAEEGKVSIRRLGSQKQQVMDLAEAIEFLQTEANRIEPVDTADNTISDD